MRRPVQISPIDKAIGKKIRHLRLQAGQTQESLAAALDVTFQQVQKYELGANRIAAGRLQSIAEFLCVPITAFFEETSIERQYAKLSELRLNDLDRALISAFTRISDSRTRRKLLKIIVMVAEQEAAVHLVAPCCVIHGVAEVSGA